MKTIICISIILVSQSIFAARVKAVKGPRVLLEMESESELKSGDELITLDANQKKRAVIKVEQVRGMKATAGTLKGQADVGYTTTARAKPAAEKAKPKKEEPEDASNDDDGFKTKRKKSHIGFFGSVNQVNMSVLIANAAGNVTANLTGSSFGISGFYDREWSSFFAIRLLGGFDQINGTGHLPAETPYCSNTTDCTFAVTYLSLYAVGRFYFQPRNNQYWAGPVFGFLTAMSKSSTVLDTAQISTNQVYGGAIGANFALSPKTQFPVSIEYGAFPSSSTVKASILTIRAGWAKSF